MGLLLCSSTLCRCSCVLWAVAAWLGKEKKTVTRSVSQAHAGQPGTQPPSTNANPFRFVTSVGWFLCRWIDRSGWRHGPARLGDSFRVVSITARAGKYYFPQWRAGDGAPDPGVKAATRNSAAVRDKSKAIWYRTRGKLCFSASMRVHARLHWQFLVQFGGTRV